MAAELQRMLQNDAVKTAVKIPYFYGDSTDQVSINEFLQRFENATRTMGLDTPAQKAKHFITYLRGAAYHVYQGLDGFGIEPEDWPAIKDFYTKKYKGAMTAHSAIITFDTLKQGKSEMVMEFFARVQTQIILYMEADPAPNEDLQTAQFRALDDASKNKNKLLNSIHHRNRMIRTFFIGGIKDSLRKELQRVAPNDLNQTLDEALKLEQTETKDKPVTNGLTAKISELADLPDDELAEQDITEDEVSKVNDMRARRGQQPFVRSNGGKAPTSTSGLKCRYCKKTGHLQKSCYTRINKGDPEVSEQGKPFRNQKKSGNKGVGKVQDEKVIKIQEKVQEMTTLFGENHLNWN